MVEIIGVTLVVILEFVEEVEKLEGEGSRRPNDCGGEPSCAKELDTTGNTISRCSTVAVPNDNAVDAIQIEDH